MNERIKQLAVEADFMLCEDGHFYSEGQSQKTTDGLQKFAELIVRECLKIVEPTEDSGDEWCVTLKGTAQEIKEHFGVEE
jgi:hypothetical protein